MMLKIAFYILTKRCKACNKPGQRQRRRSGRSRVGLQRLCRPTCRDSFSKVSEFVGATLVFG